MPTAIAPVSPARDPAIPQQTSETRELLMQQRDLTIRPGSFNEEARTVDVVFTTGARRTMLRWRGWDAEYVDEEISTDAAAVRMDRINRGGPVLNSHSRWGLDSQIGVVVDGSARMEGGEGLATLRLSGRDDVAGIVRDIRDGIIRNISVGYMVHRYDITERDGERPLYRAVDWEPTEISFVSVPADAGAGTRGAPQPGGADDAQQGGHPCILSRALGAAPEETENMTTPNPGAQPAPAADPVRAADPVPAPTPEPTPSVARLPASEIRTAITNAGLGDELADQMIARSDATGLTREQLHAEIGQRYASTDAPAPSNSRVRVSRDAGDTIRAGLEDGLHARLDFRHTPDAGRAYVGMGLIRMAEELLTLRGEAVRGLSPLQIAERALHSTSDFPQILANVMFKRLRAAYEENSPTYRRWARRAPNLNDFKMVDVTQMSAMPDLSPVGEGGELAYGTIADGRVSYKASSYGRIFGVTRQVLVNDDLRAMDRWATGFAGSASRLENRIVYGLLTGANTYAPNGVAGNLFAAGNGNLAAAGGAISAITLGAGRTAVRLQKGLQNEELNITTAYLLAPSTQEQLAYQYTSSQFVPAKSTDINEFRAGGRTSLEPIIDGVLDSISTTAWYMAADSAQVDTIEYAFLAGAEGVQLSTRPGFNIDGVEFKALHDFAGAAVDHRGLWKNPG